MGGMRPGQAKGPWVGTSGGGGPPSPGDHKVMVTGADTTPDYLEQKIVNGFGILPPVVLTPGGDEQLAIAVDLPALTAAIAEDCPDEMVACSTNDQTTGFLAAKLQAGSNVTLSIANPGASEKVQIDVTIPADQDMLVKATAADTTSEYLDDKILAGRSLAKTVVDKGAGNLGVEMRIDFPLLSGDPTVDGTWRIAIDGSGNLTFDKRIGGAWSQRGLVVG